MDILNQPTLPKTPISEQQPEVSGAGEAQMAATPIPSLEKKLESSKCECKTPTPVEKTEEKQRILVAVNGSMDGSKVPKIPGKLKIGTPNRLKLPIAFKHTERYTSPTDLMISPITKGLLARTRKGGALPSKMHELSLLYQS